MSTYILHWWNSLYVNMENKKFFEDFLKWYLPNDNLLIIPFAKDNYEECEQRLRISMKIYFPDKYDSMKIELAKEANFRDKIVHSKFIYICWWDYNKLKSYFTKNDTEIFKVSSNKVIAWSSAGTNLLSSFSYSNDYSKICDGIWLIRCATMCHYKNNDYGLKALAIEKKIPIYLIPEFNYVIIDE